MAGVKNKTPVSRVPSVLTPKLPPRKFVDYTVHAVHGDGSKMPIATVERFEHVDAIKSAYIHKAMNGGHGIPEFVVVERDYDETDKARENPMIESEVT